jgi:hypothetical protein
MSESIEYAQLMAGASSHGGDRKLAETLRSEFIDSDPEDVATTAGNQGDRITITSSGKPMTVRQVQAELQILILGE